MPSFTIANEKCQSRGLIVLAQVGVTQATEAALQREGVIVPPPLPIEFKIDTGADRSVITETYVQRLGLKPCGTCNIATASDPSMACFEYAIRFYFPNNVTWQGAVIATPGNQIQCLIGRDVLAHAVLVYIGYHNLFSLSF
ncbi:MAG TPA: retropepsin-like aspartic protease [Planctomycetota bacterium]|nr:retropepsin-like aspartic protease [Planctomycetota bacterium]